jgi:hypothetical protein
MQYPAFPDIRPDIQYPALPDIRLDIWQFNLVSGRIPDIKKGRIIRPDIRPAGYPVLPYFVLTRCCVSSFRLWQH